MPYNHRNSNHRCQQGRAHEVKTEQILNRYGLFFETTRLVVDREEKVDRYLLRSSGKLPVQMKWRTDGDQPMFDLAEPWYGWDNPNNKEGRDLAGNYDIAIVTIPPIKKVYVAKAAPLKSLLRQALAELYEHHSLLGDTFVSPTSHILIQRDRDAAKGTPKLLGFVPLDALKLGTDYLLYDF